MKTIQVILLIAFLQLNTNHAKAQPNTYSTVLSHHFQTDVHIHALAATVDNAYMLAGQTEGQPGLLLRVDSAGNFIWGKKYLANHTNVYPDIVFYSITGTIDSCFMLAGTVYNPASTKLDALLMKINGNGDTLWTKAISDSTNYLTILSVKQTFDHGYSMTGIAEGNSQNYVFAAKTDSAGNLEWSSILWDSPNSEGTSIKQTPDSGYIIAGSSGLDAMLIRLSPAGAIDWAKKYHCTNQAYSTGNDVEIMNDGFLFYMNTNNFSILLKADSSGNKVWSQTYDLYASNSSWGHNKQKLHKTKDSSYIFVSGDCFTFGGFIKVDSTGNVIWEKYLNLAPIEAIESTDHGYFVVGFGPLCGVRSRTWIPEIGIIKTDSLGDEQDCLLSRIPVFYNDTFLVSNAVLSSLTGATIRDIYPEADTITLIQRPGCVDFSGGINENNTEDNIIVFPNPSSGIFTFIQNDHKEASIEIYDAYGKTIYQSPMNSGKLEIDFRDYSTGIYFYRVISSDKIISTGKLLHTK